MTFMPLEAEERSKHGKIRWLSWEGNPSSEKMTSEDACLTHVQGIVAGETPILRDLLFRDPDSFRSGQLRTRIELWEKNFGRVRTCEGCLGMVGAWGGCQEVHETL